MHRYVIIGFSFLLILLFSSLLILHFFGDIRPALLPAIQFSKEKSSTPEFQNKADSVFIPTESLSVDLQVIEGYQIGLFAKDIAGIRDLAFSPEGVLVGSSPSQSAIFAFKIDGKNVKRTTVVAGLTKPHGIAFFGQSLFIAENNRLSRFRWDKDTLTATFEKDILTLPSGGHDAHSIVVNRFGDLYVKVGSSCNVCNETDPMRATIIKTNTEGENPIVFARGLRNAAFLTIDSKTDLLWATENGRDRIGDDIPPEEVNLVKEGKNYGWPNCYGNQVLDVTFDKKNYIRNPCEDTEIPTVSMQAHSAPLGLGFIPEVFSKEFTGDLIVAFHGSWNRSVPTGYKLVRLHFENGNFIEQTDFLTGFIRGSNALGRPVDVEFDSLGNLFVSDDKAGAIYVISKK